jgi:predicted O-methyltransferase YrrM
MFRFVKNYIKKIVRNEIDDALWWKDRDIASAFQRNATESTIEFIKSRMRDVESSANSEELIKKALSYANLERKSILEFGVYSGKSINFISSLVDGIVYGFDSFEGLPEKWRDGFGKGVFKVDQLPTVRKNVQLVEGWFCDSIPKFANGNKQEIGFLHIDCDLYSSTKTIFDLLGSRIVPGTVIVFDEFFNYPGWELGEYRAFMEFTSNNYIQYEYIGYNRCHEQVAVLIK